MTGAGAVLDAELAAVRGELARVDSKCATLAALAGAGAAYAAGQAGHGLLPARATFAAAGLVLTAAVGLVLVALRPRLGSSGFCRWSVMPAAEVHRLTWRENEPGWWEVLEVQEAARSAAAEAAETLHVLSVATAGKYRRLRLAADLAAGGVVLLAAAGLAGVVAR